MRIGMVLHGKAGFPPDIRVFKEASALVAADFEVHLLCQRLEAQPSHERMDYGLEVHRAVINDEVPGNSFVPNKLRVLGRNLRIQRPRKEWKATITQFVTDVQPDVLHCHDLPPLPVCCEVAFEHGIAIVADLHENWPGFTIAGLNQLPMWKQWLRRRLYRQWRQLEQDLLPRCSRVVVVVPEAARRVIDSYGVPEEKVVVVSNTENDLTLPSDKAEMIEPLAGHWTAVYVGGIGPHRGIDTSIRAAAIAGPKIDHFQLVVVGASKLQIPRLERLIEEAGAGDYVTVIPRVSSNLVPDYIRSSRVCLIPHNDTEHTNTTVPHKLFQYMILERPVLVSDCPPLERIVNTAQCGVVFRRNDAEHMAEQLVAMASQPEQLSNWASNGRQAALTDFAWQKDAERLIEMYHSIATKPALQS